MDLLELLSLLGFAHHLMGDDRKVKYNHISLRWSHATLCTTY